MKQVLLMIAALGIALAPAASASASERFEVKGSDGIVISKPGSYTLRRNLTARSGLPLITIAADNVSVDLNGFALRGLGDKQGDGIAINGRSNVRVFNGSLRSFGTAVRVEGSNNVELTGLQISGDDIPGGPPETGILVLNSRAVHIAGNVISRTFLGLFVRGGASGGNTIKGNTITGGENGQLGVCYNPAPGASAATDGPAGDLVAENHISRFRTAIQLSEASQSNVFVRNYLNFFELGFDERTPGSNSIVNNVEIELP